MTELGAVTGFRLVVVIPALQVSPRETRAAFAAAVREAISTAYLEDKIDREVAEEFWRVILNPDCA